MQNDMGDRRAHPRVVSQFAVVLARANRSAVYSVEDVSIVGARLIGELWLRDGDRVKLLLQLEGYPTVVEARVVRIERHDELRREIAVTFENLLGDAQDRIERFVTARHARTP